MNLPSSSGVKNTTINSLSKGTAIERNIRRQISTAMSQASDGDEDAAYRLMMMRIIIDSANGGVEDQSQNVGGSQSQNNAKDEKIRIVQEEKIHYNDKSKTTVRISELTDRVVQQSTGFQTLSIMMAFIIIVNKGEIEMMKETTTNVLTWFEEWFAFFEIIYGKSLRRWVDVAEKYKVSDRTMRRVFDAKLDLVLASRQEWPRYATYNEDKIYRTKGKWDAYENKRVVMYDNTNINIRKPSDAENQRNTYSLYYGTNVGKGGVFVQPCGWMGSHEIWAGAVSDSEYMDRGEVFRQLIDYLLTYDTTTKDTKFLNTIKHQNISVSLYMPQGTSEKIDDCSIQKLEAWINRGKLDN